MSFYTYLWLRENGVPFYVGKGKGRRAFRKGSPSIERIVLQEFPDEIMAYEAEALLIACYGRKDNGTGTLINMTDGGEGVKNISDDSKERMREAGRVHGPINGRRNVENGHLARLRATDHQRKAGQAGGRKNVESGHLARLRTTEHQQSAGRITGRNNVESGHLARLRTPDHQKSAGQIAGRRNVESGHLASLRTKEHQSSAGRLGGIKAAHINWHVKRGVIKDGCTHCETGHL